MHRLKASLANPSAIAKDNRIRRLTWEFWLCHVWLPLGLFVQITGFFWFPDTHLYKVNVVNFLLLAALLSLLNLKIWQLVLRSRAVLLILIYLLYMSLLPILRDNQEPFNCAKWSFYIALYMIAISYRLQISLQNWRRLLLVSVLICVLAIIYGLCHEILILEQWSATYRLTGSGTLYNPLRSGHLFGFFCLVALWLSATRITSQRTRIGAISATIICLFGTLFTGSRAPMLALAVSSLFLIYSVKSLRLRWQHLLIGAFIPIALIFLFWERLAERGLSLRPEIWTEAIKQWQYNPWFGTGHNAQLQVQLSHFDNIFFDTHNITLAVLFYGGLIGLILFAALHINAFYRAFRCRKLSCEAVLACALMIYGMLTLQFDGGSIISRPNETWLLLWFPIAFWLNVETQRMRDENKSEVTISSDKRAAQP